LFEAAVAGGIPLVRPLRESLVGEDVLRVIGIINGTTNYILTKMTEEGSSYDEALAEAQALGYAEADPTADVEGFDAGSKAAIIATIAFGARVVAGDVYHEGISRITQHDIAMARRLGYVVKLLGIAERIDTSGEVAVRVHPAMVPVTHPLASVRESYNAVFIEGRAVGSLMFYGRGAGGMPTASAVLGDVIDAAVNLSKGTHGSLGTFGRAPILAIDETSSQYLLSLDVADRPGVLHAVTGVFARHEVSIRAAEQEGNGPDARLVFVTHEARESSVQATVRELRELDVVRNVGGLLRVIG
jgi:homoserine dehydrogenase